jgi:hypothetical protein
MVQPFMLILTLGSWLQGTNPPLAASSAGCMTAVEERRLSAEGKIDNRIKIYRQISIRLHKAVETAVSQKNFNEIPALLGCWKECLTASLKDIEPNVSRKKKSGALKDYEIQVRKSILRMGDARLKAPYEQQEDFESWIDQATMVREKFVDILFQRGPVQRTGE